MQAPAHLATGVLIENGLRKFWPKKIKLLFCPVLFLSGAIVHGFLDAFNVFIYHPESYIWDWLGIILFLILVFFFVLVIWACGFKKYWLGMLSGIWPDIVDWGILKKPFLHDIFQSFWDDRLSFLISRLPHWNAERIGFLPELIFTLFLIYLIIRLKNANLIQINNLRSPK